MPALQDLVEKNLADHARLTGLSVTADSAYATLTDAARRAVDTAIDIGERLLTAQEDLKKDFKDWVKDTHPFDTRQAEKYMRIATHKAIARDTVKEGKWVGINALVDVLPRRDEFRPPAPVDVKRLAYTGSAVTARSNHAADTEDGYPNVSASTKETPEKKPASPAPRDADDWHTPKAYVDSARAVMGSIDFDPFSSVLANRVVKAKRFFTEADDALSAPWSATDQRTCWMNPPYSRGMSSQAVDRFLDQYDYGAFDQAIVLMNASTDTNWFHRLAKSCSAFCLTNFRIAFDNTDGKSKSNNTKGQVFFYFGPDPKNFKRVFARYGIVLDTKGMTHG